MRKRLLSFKALVLAALLAIPAVAYAATVVSSSVKMPGVPWLYVSSSCPAGSTVTVEADTTGTGNSRKSFVHKMAIAGANTFVLVRVTKSGQAVYVDLVGDATIVSLSTTATSMNITTTGHPSAAKDATDTAALVAAGGS